MKSNYKLGDLIVQRREKYDGTSLPICGVTRDGFIPPKQKDADTSLYNMFYLKDFVFNPARMELNSIVFNDEYEKAMCSSLYEVFYVDRTDIVLPEYLALIVKQDRFVRFCEFQGSGSAREYCRVANISELPLNLPSIDEQKKIVKHYSVLDKRIKLLKQINENLESNIQTIFNNRFPNIAKNGTTKLKEVATCVLGGTPSRDNPNYWNGNIAWINSGKVNDFRITTESEFITEEGLNNSATKMLPVHTVVLAITGATLGQESITLIDCCANQSVVGILESRVTPYQFIHPLIKESMRELLRSQGGGAQPHINKDDVESISFNLPDKNAIIQYVNEVDSFFVTIEANCKEIDELEAMKAIITSNLSR